MSSDFLSRLMMPIAYVLGRNVGYCPQWNKLVQEFYTGMPLSRHRRGLHTYNDCFVASQAIDWLHSFLQRSPPVPGKTLSRSQVILLLNKWSQAGLFVRIGRSGSVTRFPALSSADDYDLKSSEKPEKPFEDNSKLYRFREGSNGEPPLLCLDGIFASESARSEAGLRSSRVRPLHHSTGSAPHSIAATVAFRAPPLSSRAPFPMPTCSGERLPQPQLSSDRSCPQFAALPSLSSNSAASHGIGPASSSLPEWAHPAGLPHPSNERPSKSSRRRSRSDSRINLMDGAGIPVIDDSLSSADSHSQSQSQSQSPTVDALFKVPPVPDDDGPIMIPARCNSPSRLSDQLPVNCDCDHMSAQSPSTASHTRRAPLSREILPSAYPQNCGPVLARSCQFTGHAPSPSAHALRDSADPAASLPRSPDLHRAYATEYSSLAEQRALRCPTAAARVDAFDPATLPFNREILETALLLEQINSRHAPANFASNPTHPRPPPLPAHQKALPSAPSGPGPFSAHSFAATPLAVAPAIERQSSSCPDVQKPNVVTTASSTSTSTSSSSGTGESTGETKCQAKPCVKLLPRSISQSPSPSQSQSQSQMCSLSSSIVQPTRLTGAKVSRGSSFKQPGCFTSTHVPALGTSDQLRACTQIDEEPDEAPAVSQVRQHEHESRAAAVQPASPLSSLSSSFSQAPLRYSMHVPISADHKVHLNVHVPVCSTGATSTWLSNSVALRDCSSDKQQRQQQHPEDPIEAAVDGALEQPQQQHRSGGGGQSYSCCSSSLASSISHLSLDATSSSSGTASASERERGTSSVQLLDGAHSVSDWSVRSEPVAASSSHSHSHSYSSHALESNLAHSYSHSTAASASTSASTSASAQSLTLPTQQQQQQEQHRTPHRQPLHSAASQIASTETASSTVNLTRQELLRLLETIVNDLDMPLKVKAQRLKKFKEMYADIYYERYPSGLIESPLSIVNQQLARSKGKWGRRRAMSPAALLRAGNIGGGRTSASSAATTTSSTVAATTNETKPSIFARVLYGASFRRPKLRPDAATVSAPPAALAARPSTGAGATTCTSNGALSASIRASAYSSSGGRERLFETPGDFETGNERVVLLMNKSAPLRPASASASASASPSAASTQHVASHGNNENENRYQSAYIQRNLYAAQCAAASENDQIVQPEMNELLVCDGEIMMNLPHSPHHALPTTADAPLRTPTRAHSMHCSSASNRPMLAAGLLGALRQRFSPQSSSPTS